MHIMYGFHFEIIIKYIVSIFVSIFYTDLVFLFFFFKIILFFDINQNAFLKFS